MEQKYRCHQEYPISVLIKRELDTIKFAKYLAKKAFEDNDMEITEKDINKIYVREMRDSKYIHLEFYVKNVDFYIRIVL